MASGGAKDHTQAITDVVGGLGNSEGAEQIPPFRRSRTGAAKTEPVKTEQCDAASVHGAGVRRGFAEPVD